MRSTRLLGLFVYLPEEYPPDDDEVDDVVDEEADAEGGGLAVFAVDDAAVEAVDCAFICAWC